jgi:hypothetical protein
MKWKQMMKRRKTREQDHDYDFDCDCDYDSDGDGGDKYLMSTYCCCRPLSCSSKAAFTPSMPAA